MALIGEGVFGLDDRVDQWLPELANPRVLRQVDGPLEDTVPAERPITVRDLLTFTFGFGMMMEMFMAASRGRWVGRPPTCTSALSGRPARTTSPTRPAG